MRHLLVLSVFLAMVIALAIPTRASAVEHNFAGSAQEDYHLVPTQKGANASGLGFDGFTTEMSLKLAVDISDHLSANVKVCFGCHGFEDDMTYFDVRAMDELNVRVGRFSPSFGAFNIRHDPANHRLSDKPLPYDMGRMLRKDAWGNGVLPSPFPDNGLEVNGTHWFGENVQLDYAAYGVMGFKSDGPVDLNFKLNHQPYYVDNNGRPTVGGRTAVTLKLAPSTDLTVGASGMYGTSDPANKLTYLILGGDVSLRVDRTNVRFEYLVRREDIDVSDPTKLKYEVGGTRGDFFVKHGAYAEVEQPLSATVDLIGRVDGMYRVGNVAAGNTLTDNATVLRYTLGTAYAIERALRLKVSTELWQFGDKDAAGHLLEVSIHTAVVGAF